MTYGVENPGTDLGQTLQCGGVKPNNRIPTLPLFITGSTTTNNSIPTLPLFITGSTTTECISYYM